MNKLKLKSLEINYRDKEYLISYLIRPVDKHVITLLYLHGLGSSKSDFIEAAHKKEFDKFNIIAFDQPGCGESNYFNDVNLTIDDLKEITFIIIENLELNNIVIIGHSFGGLTALLSAHHEKIIGFIDVEGNLAPEDCFFSRYVTETAANKSEKNLFDDFEDKMLNFSKAGFLTYSQTFRNNISYNSFLDYCKSIVECSDNRNLMKLFLGLNKPKVLIYGSENSQLSYIPELQENELCKEISNSSHFFIQTNPVEFFSTLNNFLIKYFSN